MSEQALDLKSSMRIIRLHWIAVSAAVAVGLIAGAGYAVAKPPMFATKALVVLPASIKDMSTQVVVADSQAVLASALPHLTPRPSLQTLRKDITVEELTANILSIEAIGKTAAAAEQTAMAVATSYVNYVGSSHSVAGKFVADLFQPAVTATSTSMPVHVAEYALLGALIGLFIGTIGVLARNRGDRRLWQRDQIADAIGAPVFASVPVRHPREPAEWARMLEDYQPTVVDAWRLRNALSYMGVFDVVSGRSSRTASFSLTVLSLSGDQRALALGPQLAVFAASLGIPTALILGAQHDPGTAGALHTACAAAVYAPNQSRNLRIAVAGQTGMDLWPDVPLTVVVTVVDDRNPQLTEMIRTRATVLAVSPRAATPEQLARVASSAASYDHEIEGILVADPDPADHSTGRVPQLTRSARRVSPSRLTNMVVELKR
jgi:capsular polysaccharide biosynthesis protein